MKKIINMKVKEMKAITLIALVITIVVLIILAAIAINLSLGNNGIFNRAKTAKEQHQNATQYEETEVAKATNHIDSMIDGNRNTAYINYSTDEQDTGLKWIDGKSIYQRTVDCGYLPNSTSKKIYLNNLSVDNVVSLNGTAKATNEIKTLPYSHPGSASYDIMLDFRDNNTNNPYIMLNTQNNYSGYYAIVTIQYTKNS